MTVAVVAHGQPQLVENRVRLVGIVAQPVAQELPDRFRFRAVADHVAVVKQRVGVGDTGELDQLRPHHGGGDLLVVDAELQRLEEGRIAQQIGQHLVLGLLVLARRPVQVDLGADEEAAALLHHSVVTTLLVLEDDGVAAEVAAAPVELAGDDAQLEHLLILEVADVQLVEVGKLVALGIDLAVVGIAIQQHEVALLDGGRHPRAEGRARRFEILQVNLLDLGDHLARCLVALGVAGMELLEVVRGSRIQPGAREQLLVADERLRRAHHDGVVVHHFELQQLPAHLELARRHLQLGDVGTLFDEQVDVVDGEHHVGGRHGRAVRPLQAGPQVDGEGLVVVADVEALGEIGVHRGAAGGGEIVEPLVQVAGDVAEVGVQPVRRLERTAMFADTVVRGDHGGQVRQPFLYRRQLARRHQRGQHRRLLVARQRSVRGMDRDVVGSGRLLHGGGSRRRVGSGRFLGL